MTPILTPRPDANAYAGRRAAAIEPIAAPEAPSAEPVTPPEALSANLDFLRAVAVALVFWAHVFGYFGAPAFGMFEPSVLGTLGVVLFFVHTSLVLLQSLDRQHRSGSGRRFYLNFLVRRIFRIYPLSIFCVLMIVMFQLPQSLSHQGYHFELARMDHLAVATNLLLVQNFFTCGSVMDPLWSLPFEFQMYLVLPIIYLVIKRFRTPQPVVVMWAVAALAVIVTEPRFAKYNAAWAIFRLPSLSCIPCFLSGVLAYKSFEGRARSVPFAGLPALVCLAALFYLLTYNSLKAPLVALLVGASLPAFRELQSRWARGACSLIARYSYGIYLSHCFCLWFAFERLGRLGLAWRWSIFLACAAGAPVLMYHLIELPMIRLGRRVANALFEPDDRCPGPPGMPARRALTRWNTQ